jgi:hypothetical protein
MYSGTIVSFSKLTGFLTSVQMGDLFFRAKLGDKFKVGDSVTFDVVELASGLMAIRVSK